MATNQHSRLPSPPPPLFTNQPERDFVRQVNNELAENVVGQQVLYYAIDYERTNFHPLYGEAIAKTFLPPVRVFAWITWEESSTNYSDGTGVDKVERISVFFHKRRLVEDQNIQVQVGDFVRYGEGYFEIKRVEEANLLWGQVESQKVEITAYCKRVRQGLFDAT